MRSQEQAKTPPSVSVIVPIRNEEKHLSACLQAIVNQDYEGSLQVLVVDGMSEDRSRAIASCFAAAYPFIRLLKNPQRIAPAAMNTGIGHADGDVIVRVDGRTVIEPDYQSEGVAG